MQNPFTYRFSKKDSPSVGAPAPAAASTHPAPAEPAADQPLEGFLDRVDGRRVYGWAMDARSPQRRLLIEITAGDAKIAVIANILRGDLLDAGKGDGRYGFEAVFDSEPAQGCEIHAAIAPAGHSLHGSPLTADIVSAITNGSRADLAELIRAEALAAKLVLNRSA